MAKTPIPLTDTKIKNAKPKDKEYSLADGQKLSLRIKPSGSKAWIFTYQRPYTKKRTNLGFGSYPEVSLVSARKLRSEALILLAENIDPQVFRPNNIRIVGDAVRRPLSISRHQD